MQTFGTHYNPAFCGEVRVPLRTITKLPLDQRKIMARRAIQELRPYYVINLGIGVPEGVSVVAREEKILDYMTMTVEPGIIGGMPTSGLDFGASVNADCILTMPDQFDFYDGGGLDLTGLGMAQVDEEGNVNASKFGSRLAGCGGFINISQNARKVLFMGSFTAGDLQIEVENGELKILREGPTKKFVRKVDQITFSGRTAARGSQQILFITERCVFTLTRDGRLKLIEVAPGVDIEKHILPHMEFPPVIDEVQTMDPRIFRPEPMGIRDELFMADLEPDIVALDDLPNDLHFEPGGQVRQVQAIRANKSRLFFDSKICCEVNWFFISHAVGL